MNSLEVMKARHSVRAYLDKPIEQEKRTELESLLKKCNEESGLHMQIIYDEPNCFDGMMAHYSNFKGVRNYIALVGKKSNDLEERCGYYGERIVLKAQELGLNTCWVALTYAKGKCVAKVDTGEKLVVVISLGYGENQGFIHKGKDIAQVSNYVAGMPEWFLAGVEAALLAPTAMNQQKFYFTLKNDKVTAKAGLGFYTKMDLGIVKYHFEVGSGRRM